MRKLTRLNYSIALYACLLAPFTAPVLAQEPAVSTARLAPEQNNRPFVGAVNGVAFTLQENGQGGVQLAAIPTSMPVFKAFGLSRDGRRLLYTPLKNGVPSGELNLEDVSTQTVTKLPPQVLLEAAWSPADENFIACSFGGVDGYGIGVLQLDSMRFTVLVQGNLLPESIKWDQSGKGIHYLEAIGDATKASEVARYVPVGGSVPGPKGTLSPPPDFPVVEQPEAPALLSSKEGAPALVVPESLAIAVPGEATAFRVRTPDGSHEILGENVAGNGRLFLVESPTKTAFLGEGQLVGVLNQGIVVRRFSAGGTSLEYVNWSGSAIDLATSVLTFNLPVANPTLVQGGSGYAPPGNCNVGSHTGGMAYAYDLWNSAVGTHVMAAADGLVVYTTSGVTCNTIDTDCPDFSASGCSGTFFGNVVIIQHSDGTFTKYAHMQLNSVQVAPGTTVCQGLYIGRQGHTGSTNGSFNLCGDHVHFQRQSVPDIFGQSIALDFADVPSNPLSCGTTYTSASVETSDSISPSTANFGIPGGSGSVTVTSTGCSWTAVSNDAWITIVNPGSGSGNDLVTYSVADNSNSGARTGSMYIAGQTFVVTQTGGGATNQAPVVNAGSDQTITLPSTASLNGTVTDDGLPSPGVLTYLWSVVSGPGTVTFSNAPALSTSASFSMAGIYVLRLSASDSVLTSSDDLIVVINTNNGTGSLTGSQAVPPPAVDMTSEGTSDWAHWGLTTGASFDRKATGNSQISNFVSIGSITPVRYTGVPINFSWSDGTPTSTVTGTNSGIFTYNIGNGFQLTVPADTTDRTLKLYVGLYKAQGRLEVTLSDGSASPYVDTSLVNQTGASNTVFTLKYRAGGNGQSLTVRWTLQASWDTAANLTLQSATLAVNAPTPPGVLSGSLTAAPASVDLTALGTLDWAHWGLTSVSSFDHRAAVTQQISNFTQIGSGYFGRMGASPTGYSWTNGTPTTSATNTQNGVFVIGTGNGFQLTVPADTTARTLKLYLGLWDAQGKLEAVLSDGSAPSFVDTTLVNQSNTSNGLYTLTYQAGTAGQTLRIRWTVLTSFNTYANVTLQSAALTTPTTTNQAPTVNAGPDQTVTLPNTAALAGTATDDGLPNPPGTLTTTWSKVSGPGTVTFANANALSTTATFSAAGSYTLRLTASDSALSTTDDLIVTVNAANQAPTVNAGPDQSVTLPNTATLAGTATDDGLPNPPGTLTTTWSMVTGAGTVTFANANALSTTATFSAAGSYTLRLTASDSALSTTDDLIVTVNAANQAPTVNAGLDQTVTLPNTATLTGTATDDGLPNPPGTLTTTWSMVTGPGTVTFANANALSTTATFSAAGSYTLRLTANDSALSTTDDLIVTVNAANQAPTVNAGPDQSVTLPNTATLAGTATDDGLPNPPGTLTTTWSMVTGAGTVTFANTNALSTTATFSAAGSYTLRLTASDSALSTTDDLIVTVNAANQAPTVNAGPDQTVTLPNPATLAGTASDDGLPNPPGALTTTWSMVTGAGTVTFANANALSTTATFSAAGSYTLRLTASDSALSTTDDLIVTVNAANQAPTVNAGPDQTVTLPNPATLAGTASDDGLPNPPGALTTTWSMVTGAGTVTFANANALSTTATFSAAGSYTLRLTASDSALSTTDDLIVTVNAANQAPTVNAGPDQTVTLPNTAALAGTATDDGLPNPPATLTTTWSMVTGAGTVTFANANALSTTATFSAAGSYTLRLTASDSALSTTDDLIVTVNPANQAPTVNAGPDQTVTLPNTAALAGTATDDGLPNPPATLTTTWSMVTGAGTVTFANANALSTTATFSAAGSYTLRLTASDSALSTTDDLIVTVNPANQAPTVNAGANQTITLPNSATLAGTASDDGLPIPPGALTITWSVVSGPGNVTFANPNALNTTASFSAPGLYTLRLTANDGALFSTSDLIVTVNNSTNGVLSVSLATPGASVDLTAEGTLDWAHWGLNNQNSFDHRAGVTSQISNLTQVGSGGIQRQKASPTSYSWTNGTPNASVTNTPTGVYKIGTATGFQLTLPADTSLRTLRLYVGLWDAQGRLEVSLSDGSAPAILDTTLINQTATSNGVYTLTFQAASAGQTLTIRWTVQASFNNSANVTFQAATLQ